MKNQVPIAVGVGTSPVQKREKVNVQLKFSFSPTVSGTILCALATEIHTSSDQIPTRYVYILPKQQEDIGIEMQWHIAKLINEIWVVEV